MKRITRQEKTFEVLNGYLKEDNTLNIGYVADLVSITAKNTRHLSEDRFNTRRKIRNIAISELMYFIDRELYFAGYENYYSTSRQVMQWDAKHGYGLESVLDLVVEDIIEDRKERG